MSNTNAIPLYISTPVIPINNVNKPQAFPQRRPMTARHKDAGKSNKVLTPRTSNVIQFCEPTDATPDVQQKVRSSTINQKKPLVLAKVSLKGSIEVNFAQTAKKARLPKYFFTPKVDSPMIKIKPERILKLTDYVHIYRDSNKGESKCDRISCNKLLGKYSQCVSKLNEIDLLYYKKRPNKIISDAMPVHLVKMQKQKPDILYKIVETRNFVGTYKRKIESEDLYIGILARLQNIEKLYMKSI